MNRIYLVRHGENVANLTKEFSYRKVDYSLTLKGRLQAGQTAAFFVDKEIHAIYTSPLRRAIETAHAIAARLGMPYEVMECFREINVGELEGAEDLGRAWALQSQILEEWWQGRQALAFPGGEDYHTLMARMRLGIETITAGRQGRNLLVVGHGGQFTLCLPDLCPAIDASWLRRRENHNCSISEIEWDDGQVSPSGKLISWGECTHLSSEAARLVSGLPGPQTFSSSG